MAKKQNKNKAKRRFAGLGRKVQKNSEIIEKKFRMDAKTTLESQRGLYKVNGIKGSVQDEESGVSTDNKRENNKRKQGIIQKKIRTSRRRKSSSVLPNSHQESVCYEKPVRSPTADLLIFPTEIGGETCLEISCGNNEAQLYLFKLCSGSKGACIQYSDSWLTPNEFQSVSGRETAKDWKRSIRHKGKSLKMLISKGLITIQNVSFKKEEDNSCEEHHDDTARQAKSSKNESPAETMRVDGESVVGEYCITSKQKITPDTVSGRRKKGRKSKILRQTNTTAKTKTLKEKVDAIDDNGTRSPEKTESADKKHADEIKTGSENTKDNRRAQDNKIEAVQISSENTQTEEERRLDQFVKSLRLTKAIAPKQAPDLSSFEEAVKVEEDTKDEHQEMPVLQKEAEILPAIQSEVDNDQIHVDINVETFHATVTAQPTPPADEIIIDRETDNDKLIETFKSRLASPSYGLKMTINREKVKVVDADDNVNESANDINSGQNSTKVNVQSLLLQDALQSAKRYKEKLKKQNSLNPVTNLSAHKLPGDREIIGNSLYPPPPSSGIQETFDKQPQLKNQEKVSKSNHRDEKRRHVSQPKSHFPSSIPNSVPSVKELASASGMSFQDFLTVMSTIYGPLPFPVDTKAAAFAALQEMSRRHEIFRLIPQAQADGSLSSYPVMTQQLYNLCNIPDWLQLAKPSTLCSRPKTQTQHKQTPPTFDMRHYGMSHSPDIDQNDTLLRDVHHRSTSNLQENQNRWTSPFHQGMSHDKRKHSEQNNDCALDLSVKRHKVEHASLTKATNVKVVNCPDAPLDFSVKRIKDFNPYHNKEFSKCATGINSSVDMQYKKHIPMYIDAHQKSSLKMCTCGRDDDLTTWSVERVCYFLRDLDGCARYAKTFHEQGINGRLLPYLTTQHLTKTLGMEVGPALTLMQAVEWKSRERCAATSSSPCRYCWIQQPS